MLNKFLLCVLFCSAIAMSAFALQGEDTPGSRTFTEKDAQKLYESLDETNKAKWRSIEARKQDVTIGLFSPIVFYGKVVDQNGDPVPQTRISVITEVFTPNPLTLFTTKTRTRFNSDSDGFFHYNGVGRMISVYIWPPDGYDHTDYSSSRDFYYGQTYGEKEKKIHNPDKNNPVIFKLRKKEPAVLSFRFMQQLRGMKPDKDYYGDMFYKQRGNAKATLDDYSRVEPDLFYPQVKVHQTYLKESENTHIFSLDVEFLGDFQVQKGERNPLVVPESGYTGKSFHVVYKIVPPPEAWKDYKDYILSDENKWIPDQDPSFSLYVKTKNNYYGIVKLLWSPHQYLNRAYTELSINYRFNSVPGQRVFEDDSALHRELELKKWKKLEKKTQDEFFSGVKSLSEILENENSENDKNGK